MKTAGINRPQLDDGAGLTRCVPGQNIDLAIGNDKCDSGRVVIMRTDSAARDPDVKVPPLAMGLAF